MNSHVSSLEAARATRDHQTLPEISTERFTLRTLRPSDAGPIRLHASDERIAKMTTRIPHPYPPGAAEDFVARHLDPAGREAVWVIDGSGHGASELMGLISLSNREDAAAEIGYWVAPPYWNTGIAKEAVHALIQTNPFAHLSYHAAVFQDNPHSARVLTACEFAYLGDKEAFCIARDTTVAMWTYERTL